MALREARFLACLYDSQSRGEEARERGDRAGSLRQPGQQSTGFLKSKNVNVYALGALFT